MTAMQLAKLADEWGLSERSVWEFHGGPKRKEVLVANILERQNEVRGRAHDTHPYSSIGDLQVVIEHPKGSVRRGKDWEVVMPADYGYIRRVGSAEGTDEYLDCFVGANHSSPDVWVIDSLNPKTDEFDEHKIMLGFDSMKDAVATFRAAYDDGAAHRIGSITHLNMDHDNFKNWLAMADKTKPMQRTA